MADSVKEGLRQIDLPWDYKLYQALALLALLPVIGGSFLLLQIAPELFTIFQLMFLAITALLALMIIYTCSRLKEGKFPIWTMFLLGYQGLREQPKKIHNTLLAQILLELSLSIILGNVALYALGYGPMGSFAALIPLGYSLWLMFFSSNKTRTITTKRP